MSEPRSGLASRGGPLFSLRGLRKTFDGRTVLRVDSLDIGEGGITVFTGENGSGKTTLLRILNGLLAPTGGEVSFRGGPVGPPGPGSPFRSETVLVHQSPLMFRGTVAQNVALGLRFRRLPHAEVSRRVAECLGRVGLPAIARRRASSLSGGEKQRVAIARALALQPRVLLLDEPTANIDPGFRKSLENLLRSLAQSGTSLLICSHDRELAYRLGDRLIALEAGRPRECRENLIRGRTLRSDDQFTYFRAGDAEILCPAKEGDFSVAVLPLDDVLLSREPLASSARNRFPGTVTRVQEEEGLLRVTLSCGFPLQTLVTPASGEELAIETGKRYHVTFKASAVRLY
jgi:tungstate transport system ATP-binding protein